MAKNFKDPDTVINFYKGVPISRGVNVALRSRSQQKTFFDKFRARQMTGLTHIRHTRGYVLIEGEVGEAIGWDYLSFNNVAFGGGPIYATISDVEYVNPNTTRVEFNIDPVQTFMFDAKFLSSTIEREHLSRSGKTLENRHPYRTDVFELLTVEDLAVSSDLEVDYKHNYGEVTEHGFSAGHPDGTGGVVRGFGSDGLVVQFGGSRYWSRAAGTVIPPNSVVVYLAHSSFLFYDPDAQVGLDNVLPVFEEWMGSSFVRGRFPDMPESPFDDDGRMYQQPRPEVNINLAGSANGFSRAFHVIEIAPAFGGMWGGGDEAVSVALRALLDTLTSRGMDSDILGIQVVPSGMATDLARVGDPSDDDGDIHAYAEGRRKGTRPISIGRTSAPGQFADYGPTSYGEAAGYEPVMKKLYRAPFRMIRVETPNGMTHNYPLEMFDLPEGSNRAQFFKFNNFDEMASQTVAPLRFGGRALGFHDRLVHDRFPQVGYTTDAFLTYLAASYQQAITSDTSIHRESRYGFKAEFARGLESIPGYLKGLNPNEEMTGAQQHRLRERELEHMEFAHNSMAGRDGHSLEGSAMTGEPPLNDHRNAFQSDIYHAGDAAGSLGMRLGTNWWSITMVTLRGEVLRAYDEYLMANGYKSGRLGVPRVLEWIQGEDSSEPYFVSRDDMNFTYVKTTDLAVSGIPHRYAESFASIFNNGVKMINGEDPGL